jgi:hypothetical protein
MPDNYFMHNLKVYCKGCGSRVRRDLIGEIYPCQTCEGRDRDRYFTTFVTFLPEPTLDELEQKVAGHLRYLKEGQSIYTSK